MKNVLVDKQVNWLVREEIQGLLQIFAHVYEVGVDLKQGSYDENCADFCVKNTCDFLTADPKAYTHFLKIGEIKSVQISQFVRDKDPNRFVYRFQIKNSD